MKPSKYSKFVITTFKFCANLISSFFISILFIAAMFSSSSSSTNFLLYFLKYHGHILFYNYYYSNFSLYFCYYTFAVILSLFSINHQSCIIFFNVSWTKMNYMIVYHKTFQNHLLS